MSAIFKRCLVVVFIIIMYPTYALCESYTLIWQPLDNSVLDHFNVYIGTSSRKYNPPISVGKATSYTFTELQAGKTYFFAVTSVDNAGNESAFSDETIYTVSTTPGDRILEGIEKIKESRDEQIKKIEDILNGNEPLSVQDAMRLQYELMQLNLEQEVTTKASDKSSQGIQTLLKKSD